MTNKTNWANGSFSMGPGGEAEDFADRWETTFGKKTPPVPDPFAELVVALDELKSKTPEEKKRWNKGSYSCYRCVNDHVSYLTDMHWVNGRALCPKCATPGLLTFPEDVSGPLAP